MALDTNFNTRNPEKVVRLIENLVSNNSPKNTDFERRKLATIFGDDDGDEEDVNFISGTCFQNQRYGNKNSYGNNQRGTTTRVHSTRNPTTILTTIATAELMKVLFIRIHHHRPKKAIWRRCLIRFWRVSKS